MKRLRVILILVPLIFLGLLIWWKISLAPVDSKNQTSQIFVVAKGDGVKEIAKNLRDQDLIRDQVAFFLFERFFVKNDLQAGNFNLSPSMSAQEIANKLTVGTTDIWITIPEGWRSEQILEYLGKQGDWKQDEGEYFPDTYLIPQDMKLEDIRQLMLKTFAEKAGNVSRDDLILASLVEREAQKEVDRPIIAGVFKNRLDAGMALDVDATIQYALGFWKKDLTLVDLKIKSPYNTYLNPGLPPGPICNPGLSSIKAAQNPAQTDYLFYISDKSGNIHYSKTLSEHNANVAKYLQ